MNENPSVHIESAGSKTSDNRPQKNGSVVSNFSFGNSSTFTRVIMHSKQYGGCRPVFIIVINTDCEGVC